MPDEPLALHLSALEHRIVAAFMERHHMTRKELLRVMWPDSEMEPYFTHEIFKVRLCELRAKTRRFGFTIDAERKGRGNPRFICYWRMAHGRKFDQAAQVE